jgi:flagellar basal body-associated protein FliL
MPPFTAKEVCRFLVLIAILMAAVMAILWFMLHSPGRKAVPTQGTTAAFLQIPGSAEPFANSGSLRGAELRGR